MKLRQQYEEENVAKIIEGYCVKRKTTFRVNTLKAYPKEIENVLKENQITYQRVPWYEDAFILDQATENDIRHLSIYEEGKIYLQSLSSMIPALILNPQSNENILDMCAAPGGKTVQLAALSKNSSLITACEKNTIRAERMQYNLQKQGTSKITLLREDARNLNEYFSFDKILLDSPCSGSGTIQIAEGIPEKIYTEEWLKRLVKTQQVLLQKAVSLLKPGHEMVYSTCSVLKEENEEQIQKLIQKKEVEIIPINKELFSQIPLLPTTINGTITVCPTKYFEGFFIAKILKK